ncbi:hypothetical protein K438DRAFT_1953746 [Mycena galopus ATCC 62051]|nr:hypothetical protein K438DRAFT_1953746 [Mycena galopus ATCC 62051]
MLRRSTANLHVARCRQVIESSPVLGLSQVLGDFLPHGLDHIDNLPDQRVLATILKLVADFSVPASEDSHRPHLAPVAVSRFSCKWRVVAVGSPEIWTKIRYVRISHRSRSRRWAAMFVKRPTSRPLHVSTNLESYGE